MWFIKVGVVIRGGGGGGGGGGELQACSASSHTTFQALAAHINSLCMHVSEYASEEEPLCFCQL